MSQDQIVVHDVFTDELKQGLEGGTIQLIDVREPHEFEAGHIPGSVLMPLSRFDPDELPEAHGKRIVFSCRSGVRSIQALKLVQDAGIDVTNHYKPGFIGWVADGGKVSTGLK